MPGVPVRGLALLLTFVSGFTALVDEVAWQRALAILLGSHGEATAAVLAIFLAGMAAGYAAFGRLSRRATPGGSLLRLYGAVELGIGLWAFAFPALFSVARNLSALATATPPGLSQVVDLLLTAFLLGPPTFLMGATLPLLTQALARSLEDATRLHALVYGTNAVGGFLGAWSAGLWWIPTLGIDGALQAMGAVNVAVGIAFLSLAPRLPASPGEPPAPSRSSPEHERIGMYAFAAALLGFAMIALQTVWIRVAALAFGSSDLVFAVVVGVFVLCLALGSLGVAALPRVPRRAVVIAPALVALVLAGLDPALPSAPYVAHRVRILAGDCDGAYLRFQLGAAAVALGIGLAPLGLAGATLPLIFHALRRRMEDLGDRVGRLYAWNTVGSVLGAWFGGYVLLLWLDLQDVHRVAIVAIALAAALLAIQERIAPPTPILAALALTLAGLTALPDWDPMRLSTGHLRLREATAETYQGPQAMVDVHEASLVFAADDPVTSVLVTDHLLADGRTSRALYTQGKSDGSLVPDYPTMALIGLIPCLLAKQCESAFVIGLGMGVTAGELGEVESIERVVVSEISSAVIEALPWFDSGNRSVSQNPKIEILLGDASRTLIGRPERFDVIASEPSHPWASGVERVYALEFLQAARARLTPGGVYAQWFHSYEMDDETLALVLRTFAEAFDRVSVWYTHGPDLLLLGWGDDSPLPETEAILARARLPDLQAGLARAEVAAPLELLAHELIPAGVIERADLPGPLHTLLHPRLADRAGRAFFHDRRANLPLFLSDRALERGRQNRVLADTTDWSDAEFQAVVDETCASRPPDCATWIAAWRHARPESGRPSQARLTWSEEHEEHLIPERIAVLLDLYGDGRRGLPAEDARRVTDHFLAYYHHVRPFPRESLAHTWATCTGPGCEEGRDRARDRLAGDTARPGWQPMPRDDSRRSRP